MKETEFPEVEKALWEKYKASKYKNAAVIIDGIKFSSTGEGKRYSELKLLERAGHIRDLKLQPVFRFESGIKYIADFSYFFVNPLEFTVEDYKGQLLPVYKLKKKLFIWEFIRTGIVDRFLESHANGTVEEFTYKEKKRK
jgi:hypothetical protein